jgi:predicted metal-dependent HD superfamily phosphohydrolase
MARFAEMFPDLVTGLHARYNEAHRAYHTWAHIEALLGWFEKLDWAHGQAVEIAVYYHDAVYEPLSPTNEADSAALMVAELSGRVDDETIARAGALILATAGHQLPETGDAGLAADCALFLDADLSILGAEPGAFDAYDQAIRAEFAAIPDEVFLPRRRRVMAGFLERERLFRTERFHQSHDGPARENLRRLVARLG